MLLLCTRAQSEWSPQGLYHPLKFKKGIELQNFMVLAVKKRVKLHIEDSIPLIDVRSALHIQPHA